MTKSEYYIVVKGTKIGLEIVESSGVSSIVDTGEAGKVHINLATPAQISKVAQEGVVGLVKFNGSVTFMPELPEVTGIGEPKAVLEIYSHVDGLKVGQGVITPEGTIVADCLIDGETHVTISGDLAE